MSCIMGEPGELLVLEFSTEEQFVVLILIRRSRNKYINTTTAWILKTLRSLTEREMITNDYFWKHCIPKETPVQGMTT